MAFGLLNFNSPLFFLVLRAISHLFNTIEKYSSVLMMTSKITMSVNFISISPTSLLGEQMTSLNTTDNSFLLNIFPVYCDLNLYSLFYYSSLSSLFLFNTMSNTLLKSLSIRATIFSFNYKISFNRLWHDLFLLT